MGRERKILPFDTFRLYYLRSSSISFVLISLHMDFLMGLALFLWPPLSVAEWNYYRKEMLNTAATATITTTTIAAATRTSTVVLPTTNIYTADDLNQIPVDYSMPVSSNLTRRKSIRGNVSMITIQLELVEHFYSANQKYFPL